MSVERDWLTRHPLQGWRGVAVRDSRDGVTELRHVGCVGDDVSETGEAMPVPRGTDIPPRCTVCEAPIEQAAPVTAGDLVPVPDPQTIGQRLVGAIRAAIEEAQAEVQVVLDDTDDGNDRRAATLGHDLQAAGLWDMQGRLADLISGADIAVEAGWDLEEEE